MSGGYHTWSKFNAHRWSNLNARRQLTGLSVIVGLMGVDITHFWLTLILLGVGWNFGFIGASALVLECHRPEEKNRVQSFNDFIVFGAVAFGSFLSGGLLTAYGWNTVLWLSFVPLVLAILALARMVVKRSHRLTVNRPGFRRGSEV